MATYFVASGGSNTSPYDTWAKAATSFATAIAAATVAGDIIVIQYNAVPSVDAEVAATITHDILADISIISASNDGGSAYTPTAMGTSYWMGSSTAARSLNISADNVTPYIYGITFRFGGSTSVVMAMGTSNVNTQITCDTCKFWLSGTAGLLRFGVDATASATGYIKCKSCTFKFNSANHLIYVGAALELENCSIDSDSTIPSTVVSCSNAPDAIGVSFVALGCDFSRATGANLVGDVTRPVTQFQFIQCKLPTSYTILAAQSVTNNSAGRVWISDCSSGDTHGILEYADAAGTLTMDTGIYYTGTPSSASWKIVTNAICSDLVIFETPWIDFYNTTLSSLTPRFEILRDGSSSAYNTAQIWGEWFVKITSGTPNSLLHHDRMTLNGTPVSQATGAGLSSWTGESGTAWSGKLASISPITPAEIGSIRGRVCVAMPSATVYVDPFIRTA